MCLGLRMGRQTLKMMQFQSQIGRRSKDSLSKEDSILCNRCNIDSRQKIKVKDHYTMDSMLQKRCNFGDRLYIEIENHDRHYRMQ